jgi:hypothetical protein
MAIAQGHPTAAELVALSPGTLGDAAHALIEAHVAGCPSCLDQAADVPGDQLINLLRTANARKSQQADTVADRAGALTLAPVGTAALEPAKSEPNASFEVPPELAHHERYRVLRLLGKGGMGAVSLSEHRDMQRLVALKVIMRVYTCSPAAVERFRREVRAAAWLAHPNRRASRVLGYSNDCARSWPAWSTEKQLSPCMEQKGMRTLLSSIPVSSPKSR